jgi:predicted ATP-grasp superfamily ATP-dependent carboligase
LAEKQPFKVFASPNVQDSSMVVAWSEDAGKLGSRVVDYLNKRLQGQVFAEIDPADYFALDGVSVQDDVAQFPDSKFYSCQEKNLVIFKSNLPRAEWYEFLNSVLDVAEHSCKVKELYTIGGMVSSSAHTTPRVLLAIANSPEMKEVLKQYDLASDMDYETPPGQRPTLSSFLLWAAKRRNIAGASLWVPVPFYLVATEDPGAWRKVIEFLNRRFGLGIDLGNLDQEVAKQNEKIADVRSQHPELDGYINKLESNVSLTMDENEKLAEQMEELLRKRRWT